MFRKLFPERIDSAYGGHPAALWLFGALVLMKGAVGLGTIFNGRSAAVSADGIPLDTFTTAGEQAFISLFAAWGLSQLVLNLIGLLVLIRYRAMVPLMFGLLLAEHVGRRVIFWILPMPRTDTPPGLWVNLVFVVVMIVGLTLSLRHRNNPRQQR